MKIDTLSQMNSNCYYCVRKVATQSYLFCIWPLCELRWAVLCYSTEHIAHPSNMYPHFALIYRHSNYIESLSVGSIVMHVRCLFYLIHITNTHACTADVICFRFSFVHDWFSWSILVQSSVFPMKFHTLKVDCFAFQYAPFHAAKCAKFSLNVFSNRRIPMCSIARLNHLFKSQITCAWERFITPADVR